MKLKIKNLIEKYYYEEISKEEFVREFSKHFNSSKFVLFMERNIEGGSIKDLEKGIKKYKRVTDIDVVIKV